MSEQETQSSGGGSENPAIIMVDQTASHVKTYRAKDIKQDSDLLHKRSRAPAVPSVAEELKNLAEDALTTHNVDSKELVEGERAMSSEHKHTVTKKSSKRPDLSPDIPLVPLDEGSKKDISSTLQQKSIPSQPIPPQIKEEKSDTLFLQSAKDEIERTIEEDSITEEITELQSPDDGAKKHSEWSDDEEAGGLPRSESRASRMSRAVRQLFCCGVRYEPASEDNISSRSGFNHGI